MRVRSGNFRRVAHQKTLQWLTAAAIAFAPLCGQDLVVLETLGGSANVVSRDQTLAAGWTQSSAANNANIWVHLFANELPAVVNAYLVRGLGLEAAGREVASTRVTASTDRWEKLFSNVNLSPGTYYVVLSPVSGVTGWRQVSFGFERLAQGVTLEPAKFSRGALPAYPPSAIFTNLPDSNLALIVSTDADYFAPFTLIVDSISDAFVGQAYSCALTHTRPGPGPFRWTVQGSLPPGLTLVGDERTGALRLEGLIPPDTPAIPYPLSVQLIDTGRNRSARIDTRIDYVRPGALTSFPVVRTSYHRGGMVGQRFVDHYDVHGGVPPYRFSFTGSLPLGLTLDEATGELSGTPTAAGTVRASIFARDANNRQSTSTELPYPIAPATQTSNLDHLNTGSPQRMLATAGADFDQTLALGVSTTAIEPHLSLLPPGLTLSSNGRLAGRVSTPGNYGFCLRGQTRAGRVIRCFWVIALAPRQAAFRTLPAANPGVHYDQALFSSLSGGLAGQYFYEVLDQNGQPVPGNVIAPGLILTGAGRIAGTPTQTGTFPIRVRIRDYSSYWAGGNSNTFTSPSPLTISIDPNVPAISGVTHGASFDTGGIVPGLVITLFGTNLGPEELTTLTLGADSRVETTLAGTQVTVNNIPAPILYTSQRQVSVVVPFGVSGVNASIAVTYNGRTTAAFTVPIGVARPALFTRNGSGRGLPAALNQDGSLHGADAPAARGSILVLYGSGAGPTQPSGVDGALTSTPTQVLLPVLVTIGGLNAEVLFAGAAPGLVAGVFQLNVRVPANVTSGDTVPLVVSVGNNRSPDGVFIAVR